MNLVTKMDDKHKKFKLGSVFLFTVDSAGSEPLATRLLGIVRKDVGEVSELLMQELVKCILLHSQRGIYCKQGCGA